MAGKELKLAISIGGKLDGTLGSAINAAERQLGSLGKNINTAVNAAAGAAVAGGVALVVDSTKRAIEYEKAMAGVAKVVDDCRDANGNLTDTYYELSDGILDMSTKIPMAAKDIAAIVESAGQSNIAKEELLDFAESAAKMGIAFDTTAEQAGDWMAQWRTSMGLTQPEVETLADQINYLGNTSSEQAVKLAEVVSRVGSLGQIAGLSGGEVAALAAAMPGVEAEIAATGIKNMTKAMTAGSAATKRQQTVLSKLGFDANELAERMQVDAKGAILDFLGALQQLPEAEQSAALTQYFGSESVAAIAPLLANLDNLREQFDKVGNSSRYAGSMQKEYEAAADTTENKIQLLTNTIEKEQIKLGQKILPLIGDAAEQLAAKMPELFETISAGLEKIIPKAAELASYLIENSDKIVSGAVSIGKAYAGIKVGTGVAKTIKNTVTLGKALKNGVSVLSATAGAGKAVGAAAKVATSSVTGLGSAFVATIAPMAGVTAVVTAPFTAVGIGAVAASKAIDAHRESLYQAADETLRATQYAQEQARAYQELSSMTTQWRNGLEQMELNPPDSAAYQTAYQQVLEAEQYFAENAGVIIDAENRKSGAIQGTIDALNLQAEAYAQQAKLEAQSKVEEGKTKVPELIAERDKQQELAEAHQADAEALSALANEVTSVAAVYDTLNKTYTEGVISTQQYEAARQALLDGTTDFQNRYKELMGTEFTWGDSDMMSSQVNAVLGKAEEMNGVFASNAEAVQNAIQAIDQYKQAAQNLTELEFGMSFADAIASGSDKLPEMLNYLTELQHAMGLLPENMTLQISEDGTIQEVLADVQELEQATGEEHTVQVGAVADIEALEGLIEGLTGVPVDIPVDATVTTGEIESKGFFEALLDSILGTKTASAAELTQDVTVQAGNVDTSGVQSGINAATAENTQDAPPATVTQDVDVQAGNVDTSGVQGLLWRMPVSFIGSAPTATATQDIDVQAGNVNTSGVQGVINTLQTSFISPTKNVDISVNATDNASGKLQTAKNTVNGMPTSKNISLNASGNAQTTAQQTQSAINLIPPTKISFLNANGNAITTANKAQDAIQKIPTSKTIPVNISGSAVSTATRIRNAVNDLPTSKTITINIKTNGSVPNLARGIRNAPGGTYMVNDQNISDPREVIEHDGIRYWYDNRNVITTLPRGANVYSAAESRAFIDGSHRNGLRRVPFDGYIAELHRNEQILTDDEAEDYRNGGVFARAIDRLRYTRAERDSATDSGAGGGSYTINYSPNIVIEGDADEAAINRAFRQSYEEFKNNMERYNRDLRRTSFSA